MIKRMICAIQGHKKCLDIKKIIKVYDKTGTVYDKVYHCPRCRQRVFAGKGLLYCEILDIAETMLKDLPRAMLEDK